MADFPIESSIERLIESCYRNYRSVSFLSVC